MGLGPVAEGSLLFRLEMRNSAVVPPGLPISYIAEPYKAIPKRNYNGAYGQG